MKALFLITNIYLLIVLCTPKPAFAGNFVSSEQVTGMVLPRTYKPEKPDYRAEILRKYLSRHDSPLAGYAEDFIKDADKNGIDWKLLPAIAGVESGFGNVQPAYSYNGWGYGYNGTTVRRFNSWKDGISVISEAIRSTYMDVYGIKDVYDLGARYATDRAWGYKVQRYMDEMEFLKNDRENSTLSISL